MTNPIYPTYLEEKSKLTLKHETDGRITGRYSFPVIIKPRLTADKDKSLLMDRVIVYVQLENNLLLHFINQLLQKNIRYASIYGGNYNETPGFKHQGCLIMDRPNNQRDYPILVGATSELFHSVNINDYYIALASQENLLVTLEGSNWGPHVVESIRRALHISIEKSTMKIVSLDHKDYHWTHMRSSVALRRTI